MNHRWSFQHQVLPSSCSVSRRPRCGCLPRWSQRLRAPALARGSPGGAEFGATVQYPPALHAALLTARENPDLPSPDPPRGTFERRLPTRVMEASLPYGK